MNNNINNMLNNAKTDSEFKEITRESFKTQSKRVLEELYDDIYSKFIQEFRINRLLNKYNNLNISFDLYTPLVAAKQSKYYNINYIEIAQEYCNNLDAYYFIDYKNLGSLSPINYNDFYKIFKEDGFQISYDLQHDLVLKVYISMSYENMERLINNSSKRK